MPEIYWDALESPLEAGRIEGGREEEERSEGGGGGGTEGGGSGKGDVRKALLQFSMSLLIMFVVLVFSYRIYVNNNTSPFVHGLGIAIFVADGLFFICMCYRLVSDTGCMAAFAPGPAVAAPAGGGELKVGITKDEAEAGAKVTIV